MASKKGKKQAKIGNLARGVILDVASELGSIPVAAALGMFGKTYVPQKHVVDEGDEENDRDSEEPEAFEIPKEDDGREIKFVFDESEEISVDDEEDELPEPLEVDDRIKDDDFVDLSNLEDEEDGGLSEDLVEKDEVDVDWPGTEVEVAQDDDSVEKEEYPTQQVNASNELELQENGEGVHEIGHMTSDASRLGVDAVRRASQKVLAGLSRDRSSEIKRVSSGLVDSSEKSHGDLNRRLDRELTSNDVESKKLGTVDVREPQMMFDSDDTHAYDRNSVAEELSDSLEIRIREDL